LTETGHGAAPWSTWRKDETSVRVLVSSGSESSRWNIVGTMWVWVTRSPSMCRSARSASKLSITTTVAPHEIGTARENASGAAWYSGPVHRCTSPPSSAYPPRFTLASAVDGGVRRYTPFGRPVVPDV